MERLNLRSPKVYDMSSESEIQKPRVCFYCVSEGPTEESYFYGVRNNKIELDIKGDVQIHVIEKSEGQESLSHPLQLVMSCLMQMGRIDEEGNPIPSEKWSENCKWDNFDPELDQVCVIFDRDYRNLERELDNIYGLCNEHKIKIVISNPNFELWLLMHFPNMKQYDSEKLLENKKNLRYEICADASKNKKYLEILVSKNAGGYSKGSKIRFEKFMPYIDLAVQQAKEYCEDPDLIRNSLGTSVGKLIEQMRE